MYQAVKYLISLNHTEIGYLSALRNGISRKSDAYDSARAQRRGADAQSEIPSLVFSTIEWGCVTNSILRLPAYPTAIMTFNDRLQSALHAIRTFGLTVPDDISVVGFDDIYLTPHTNPSLTTISQPQHWSDNFGC